MSAIAPSRPDASVIGMTFARARLWLGMSTVAVLVAGSSLLLTFDVPARLLGGSGGSIAGEAALLGVFVACYAVLHAVSDVVGAFVIPAGFGRRGASFGRTAWALLRGVAAHGVCMWLAASALLVAGWFGGLMGVVGASLALAIAMLSGRMSVASFIGGVRRSADDRNVVESTDDGFTGGIDGALRPAGLVVPAAWRRALSAEELGRVLERRRVAITSGSWLRGRLLGIGFTLAGVLIAGLAVGAEALGTAAGIVELSLWFTLWSFLGLLTLPTLSRRAVALADAAAGENDVDMPALAALDRLGDDERERPALIETIFHPLPGLDRRREPVRPSGLGFWDVARIALYISPSGLGLLGRAVHCNCGRPALWAYLPSA